MYLLTHGQIARTRLNHPQSAALRRRIAEHSGPWEAEDIEDLNALAYGGLIFESKNGQLHVRCAGHDTRPPR